MNGEASVRGNMRAHAVVLACPVSYCSVKLGESAVGSVAWFRSEYSKLQLQSL